MRGIIRITAFIAALSTAAFYLGRAIWRMVAWRTSTPCKWGYKPHEMSYRYWKGE